MVRAVVLKIMSPKKSPSCISKNPINIVLGLMRTFTVLIFEPAPIVHEGTARNPARGSASPGLFGKDLERSVEVPEGAEGSHHDSFR